MLCSARFFCVHVRIRITKTARGRVCSIRSSAALVHARARFHTRTMPSWCRRRTTSCRAKAEPCASFSPATCRRRPNSSISNAPRDCATALRDSPQSRDRRASTPNQLRKPTFSRSPKMRASSVSRFFFFRTYQNWGNRAYFPRADRSLTTGEVLGAFLAQFYSERPAPRLLLLSAAIEDTELLAEALCQRAGHRVEIAVPQRGEKRELVEAALQNARATLGRKLADTASQTKLLSVLGEATGAPGPVRRVEVYDNSHIMGTNAIGAMIVAGPAGFMKTHYRTFNIRSEELTPGDDYGMMREVLRRRFSRLMKEAPRMTLPHPEAAKRLEAKSGTPDFASAVSNDDLHSALPFETHATPAPRGEDPDAFPSWPDLVLIDGGRGQFDAARQVFAELGVTGVTLVSIAKGRDRDAGRETFFVEGREPFHMPPRDPALYFAERLRDEAHRFAIGTHRARRKREFTRSPLDEIGGIGPARKRALLQSFGTAKAISRAALADLEKVPGINAATARLVYDYFHERR